MEDLKITFEMAGHMVMPQMPLHLDALLAYSVTEKEKVFLDETSTLEDLRRPAENLPVEKYEQDGEWVYMASALMPEGEITHSSRFYTQRIDQAELAKNISAGHISHGRSQKKALEPRSHAIKLDVVRGDQRNLLGYFSVSRVEKMVGYCVGDRDEIEEIIEDGYVTHLGPRRRQGYGLVKSIHIEQCEQAREMWKQRIKPFALTGDDEPLFATVRPPYFDSTLRQAAFVPWTLM